MQRLRLDPFSPNGVSVVTEITKVEHRGNGGAVQAGVTDVIAGANVTIDKTNPQRPIISSSGGGGGGGISDGDKGDITVSSSGTVWTVDSGLAATKIANGSVSDTEFQYLDGVTSSIQTQLGTKQATLSLTTTGSSGPASLVGATLNIPQYSGGGGGTVDSVVAGNNIDVDSTDPANPIVSVETLTVSDISNLTASATELNYVGGVTSAIQTQLNTKMTGSSINVLLNKDFDTGGVGNTLEINGVAVTANTGTGAIVRATSPAITTPTGIVKGDVGLGNVDNTSDTTKNSAAVALTNKDLTSGTNTFPTFNQNTTGSAAKLTTARNIAGVAFDGTTNISLASTNLSDTASIALLASTQTFTNKRITKRTGTTTSSATPIINTDTVDFYSLTAQTVDITSFTTNLSGTPTTGQTLWIAITGTGARAITWGASFEASTVALPTTTVSTNRLDVGFIWTGSVWRCIAVA